MKASTTAFVYCALAGLGLGLLACREEPARSELVSAPIIHIGKNEADPKLMETAILVVIQASYDTVRRYVSDPANIENYIAFAEASDAEPFPGGPATDQLVRIRMGVDDVFGVKLSGEPLELRWHPLQESDAVFAYSFEKVSGAYEHLSGSLYAANLHDGSTAVMLRTTSRTGFVPEAVRERLARWHAEQSVRKLAALLESQSS